MRLIDADALLEKAVEADRMGAMLVVGKGFIMSAPTVVPALDEMGRDNTTTVTRDICYDYGEITNYGAYRCDKCGAKQPDRYPHCPGCGRRIERRGGVEMDRLKEIRVDTSNIERKLTNVIVQYNDKFISTGALNPGAMAEDCLCVIRELQADIDRLTAERDAALLEGRETAKDTWIPIEECTPVEGEVVEIVSISKADRARYTPSNNPFFPWSLIDWPTPETEEGTFSRRREAVTHWRRGPEPGGEGKP